jgi:hypothetical protein
VSFLAGGDTQRGVALGDWVGAVALDVRKRALRFFFPALTLLATLGPIDPQPVMAADTVKIGTCLLKNCQLELARCLLDPKCFANIICLNACNDKEDETACQIGCGNLFENDVVGQFNGCALSKKQCVPQRQVSPVRRDLSRGQVDHVNATAQATLKRARLRSSLSLVVGMLSRTRDSTPSLRTRPL